MLKNIFFLIRIMFLCSFGVLRQIGVIYYQYTGVSMITTRITSCTSYRNEGRPRALSRGAEDSVFEG